MSHNPVILTADVAKTLDALRDLAAAHPVSMPDLNARLKTSAGKERHMRQMMRQTVPVPLSYVVTYSIETGHPIGTCRHMSMSSGRSGHVPIPEAVWMICENLGFQGSLRDCTVWVEDIDNGTEKAINVVQPVATAEPARA